MKKYLVLMALVLAVSVYTAKRDRRFASQSAEEEALLRGEKSVTATTATISQEDVEKAKLNSPSWFIFFRWPEGAGACCLILTLLAIAEQTRATSKATDATVAAAKASLKQVRLARKTLVLQFRPKLVVRGGRVADDGTLKLWVTNIGGARAYASHFALKFSVIDAGDSERSEEFDYLDVLAKHCVLGAGETVFRTLTLHTRFAQALSSQLSTCRTLKYYESTRLFICAGGLSYRDELGIERTTMVFRQLDLRTVQFTARDSDGDYAD